MNILFFVAIISYLSFYVCMCVCLWIQLHKNYYPFTFKHKLHRFISFLKVLQWPLYHSLAISLHELALLATETVSAPARYFLTTPLHCTHYAYAHFVLPKYPGCSCQRVFALAVPLSCFQIFSEVLYFPTQVQPYQHSTYFHSFFNVP